MERSNEEVKEQGKAVWQVPTIEDLDISQNTESNGGPGGDGGGGGFSAS